MKVEAEQGAAAEARGGALARLEQLLSEPVMGFLALVAACVAIAPFVFDMPHRVETVLDGVEWTIVGIFAFEFVFKLATAPSRIEYLRSPYRLLDLAIIVLPLGTLLAPEAEALRGSPVLRLLRLARFAVLGLRTRSAVRAREEEAAVDTARLPLEIRGVRASEPGAAAALTWPEFVEQLADPDEEWFYLSGVEAEDFPKVSAALRLPEGFLRSKLVDGSHARIDVLAGHLTIFVQYPRIRAEPDRPVEIERTATLIVGSEHNLVTLAREPRGLHQRMLESLGGVDPAAPFLVRTLYSLVKHLLQRCGEVVEALEREVAQLELTPSRETSPEFLEGCFHLKRQIATTIGNLWHVKEMVRAIAEKRIEVKGFDAKHQAMFQILADDADYRYETADNAREALISLIELHLNVVSFEMNKVMRILAIMTTLALLPSVIGGLFGMNLDGIPKVLFLHVVYGVAVGMALCVYVFAIKGWLR